MRAEPHSVIGRKNLFIRLFLITLVSGANDTFTQTLLAQAQAGITLLPSSSPSAAQPGVTVVNLTGLGFPAGMIAPSQVAVTLQVSPGGSGPAFTVSVSSVTVLTGSTRRITFQIEGPNVTRPTPYLISISGSTTLGTGFASSNQAAITINPPAAVTSLNPPQGRTGQSLAVAISGQFTNYLQGSTQASFGAGISVGGASVGAFGPVTVNSPTSAVAQLIIDPAAPAGLRDVSVATGVQTATLAGVFTVTAGTPAITLVNPNSGNQGQSALAVTITGNFTHFSTASVVTFSGTGITAGVPIAATLLSLTVPVTVSGNAPLGAQGIQVETGGEMATLAGAFTVTAGTPAITLVNPNNGLQGQNALAVTITSQFTHFLQGSTTASFGAGITVASLAVSSATSATAVLNIGATATVGARNVSLTTGGEVVTLTNGFTVVNGSPVLTQVSPNTGQQGQQNVSVALTGQFTHFVQGTTAASFGTGITVASLAVSSATSATAVLNISVTAPVGAGNVSVTTGGEVITLINGFTVVNGTPVLTQVSPNTGQQGQQNLSVALTGQFTHFLQGTTTASFGAGITVASLAVGSATSATAVLNISVTAPLGAGNISVTTGGEVITLINGFTVVNGTPVLTQVSPNTGQQGQQNLSVALTGQFTHFLQGTTTASFGAGITVASLSVNSATSATAVLNISATAPAGAGNVSLTTGGEVVTLTNGFTVTNGTPMLTQVNPNMGQQGTLIEPRGAIITFDNPPAGLTPNFFIQGTPVSASSQLTNQFENLGVIFTTFGGAPYAALIDLTGQAPSGTNGIGAVNASGNVDYSKDLDIFLVVPGTTVAAVTDFISIQGDEDPIPGNVVFSAYDTNGNLLVSGVQPDTAGGVYSLSAPGIHEFRLHSTSATVAYDNLSFDVPATLLSVALTGQFTHFAQGTTTASFGAGITVASLTVSSTTSATALLNVSATAVAGARDVIVTTAGEVVTLTNGFTVTNGTPLLSQADPNNGAQGRQNLSVALTGQFTQFAQGASTASFGVGVSVSSLTVSSPTSATAVLNIAANAVVGFRDATVTSGGETVTLADGFTVTNAPVLTQIFPFIGQQGQLLSVVLVGQFTHFVQGTTTASFGAGITVTSLTVNSSTSATAVVNISPSAALGARDVSVVTGPEAITQASGFIVTAGTPVITQVSPNAGQQGQQNLPVTVSGQFTHFVQGTTTASFGVGITVASLTVTSATSATAVLSISATRVAGATDVTLTTGTETATLPNGFAVTAGIPALTGVAPNSGQQGQSNLSITISGQFTHFSVASAVSFTGGGISAGTPISVTATSLALPVSIASNANIGARGVQISSGTEVVSLASAFTVAAAGPSITSVTPGSALPAQSVQVTVTGQNTHFVQGTTTANFGPGVMVGNGVAGAAGPVLVTGPTTATAQISVPANAALGSRTVYVSTGNEQASLANGFAVNGPPALISAAPSSGQQGQALTVVIGGEFTNFQQGLTVASFGAGISVGGAASGAAGPVSVTSATSATAQLNIAANAAVGLRTVSVATGANQESLAAVFVVLGPVTSGPPTVTITSPVEGSTITTLTNVTGNVTSPDLANWILEYSSSGGNGFVQFAEGTGSAVTGSFDPSLLLNGMATIRLTAMDQSGQTTSTTVDVVLTRNAKVGNFTVTFTDLSIPVAGLPIQVNRIYDSRNKANGDFGFGWNLSYNTVAVQVNGVMGNNWSGSSSGGFFPTYCVLPPVNLVVSVRLQNGTVYQFSPVASNDTQCQQLVPPESVDIAFVPVGQTPSTATLSAPGGAGLLIVGGFPGTLQLVDFDTALAFDPDQFVLTLPNGETLQLSRTFGLQTVIDTNGNALTFSANGIVSSTGNVVSFNRDSSGRITTITDPNQNVLNYTYSPIGDLATSADALRNTSSYSYDTVHDLLGYTNPLGVQGLRNTYDDSGRLIQITDALGHITDLGHDPISRTETITDARGNPTTYAYDASGDLLAATDPLGQTFTATYDTNGNQLTSSSPFGLIVARTYDSANNLLSETDALGNQTTYTYNGLSQILTTTDPLGHITTNTYDAVGNLLSTKDARGNTTSTTYNAQGQPLTSTDALGHVTSYQYDANGYLTEKTDAAGVATLFTNDANGNQLTSSVQRTRSDGTKETLVTQFQYDAHNNLLTTTNPDGSIVANTYDALNRKTAATDALGKVTQYGYDADGRAIQTIYPDGSTKGTSYDANGNRTGTTDAAGDTTSYQYDAANHLSARIFPDGTKITMTHDAVGRIVQTVDPLGNATNVTFDAAGRQTSVINALNQTTTMTYDADGKQISQTDANNNTTQYIYDALGQRTKVIYPDSTFETTAYDANGQVISVTDQAGMTTLHAYDQLGRLLSTTDAAGQVTSYTYDEVGNRLSQTDASGRRTLYSYDEMGRRLSRTLPLDQKETYLYDTGGNLTAKTDFNGRATTYTYDLSYRLTSKTADPFFTSMHLGAAQVLFTYTADGMRSSMSDGTGTTTYAYDALRRLTQKVTPMGTLSYAYDAAGHEISVQSSHNGGAGTTYAYDALNRLQTATDASGVSTYVYDAVGNTSSLTYPNGVRTSLSYDAQNRLTSIGSARNGIALAEYDYTLEPAGHRVAVQELSGRKVAYVYDSLYRLTSETISGATAQNGSIGYTLDRTGNRIEIASSVPAVSASTADYDANDRLSADTYDSAGNTLGSNGTAFSYDFENHLVQSGGVTVAYDGDGNRVSKTVNGVTTFWLLDSRSLTGYSEVLEELQGGVVTRAYSYGSQLLSERQAINGSTAFSFYGYDGSGSVRFLLDTNGVVTDTYSYDAFGNLLSSTGSTPNLYLFSGQQWDPDLKLYYNRARYLDPASGRFRTMDSYEGDATDPRTLHKYLYAEGNPVSNSDPGGHCPTDSCYWGVTVHADIGDDFVEQNGPNSCSDAQMAQLVLSLPFGPASCGYLAVGLSRAEGGTRPDLAYPVDSGIGGGGGQIFEIKPYRSAAKGLIQVVGYLELLRLFDERPMPPNWRWHLGEASEYTWGGSPAIYLTPLNWAVVLPAVAGVILYYVSRPGGVDALGVAASLAVLHIFDQVRDRVEGRTIGQIISEGEAADEAEAEADEDTGVF